jgi:hypothetical protein
MKELDLHPKTLQLHEISMKLLMGNNWHNGLQESIAGYVCYFQVPEEDSCEANPTFEETSLLICQQWSIPEQDLYIYLFIKKSLEMHTLSPDKIHHIH